MADTTGERRRIAGFLEAHGPTHGDRLAEQLGLPLARFWPLINCGWFDIVTGGWGLTERGRTEGLTGAVPGRPGAVGAGGRAARVGVAKGAIE